MVQDPLLNQITEACNGRSYSTVTHSTSLPLSHLATGPVHTFSSGKNSTTLDYIVGNFTTFTVMVSCHVEEEHPLNTSDHLPIMCKLNLSLLTIAPTSSDHVALDWTSAIKDGCNSQYASLTNHVIAPFIKKRTTAAWRR